MTFSEYLNYWVENPTKPNTAQRTLENYQYMITQHIKQGLGYIKISNLQPAHLQEYYVQKLNNGKIDGTGLSATLIKHQHK